jgi:hypothetical protein
MKTTPAKVEAAANEVDLTLEPMNRNAQGRWNGNTPPWQLRDTAYDTPAYKAENLEAAMGFVAARHARRSEER